MLISDENCVCGFDRRRGTAARIALAEVGIALVMYMYRQEEREREKEITWSSCFFCVCCTEEYLKERYLEMLYMHADYTIFDLH